MAEGKSLVVVNAAYGRGQRVNQIMARCNPLDTKTMFPPERRYNRFLAAPLSSSLGLPVLIRNQPAPITGFIGFSPLTRGRSFLSRSFAELSRSRFTFNSFLGLGLTSRKAAPFSSMLGLKTVSRSTGPWKSSMGLPLLSRNPAPLSSLLGIRVLSRNATPLSSKIGIPPLSS